MRHIPKGAGPPPPDLVRKPKGQKDKTTVQMTRELVAAAHRRACTLEYLLDLVKEEWQRRQVGIEKAAKKREENANFVRVKVK